MKTIETPHNIYLINLRELEEEYQSNSRALLKEINKLEAEINDIPDKVHLLTKLREKYVCDMAQYEREFDAIQLSLDEKEIENNQIFEDGIKEIGHPTKVEINYLSEFDGAENKTRFQTFDIDIAITNLDSKATIHKLISGEALADPKTKIVNLTEEHFSDLKGLIPEWQIKEVFETAKTHFNNDQNWW